MDLPIRGFQGIVQRTVRNNVIIIKAYKLFIVNCTKGLGRVLARRSKNHFFCIYELWWKHSIFMLD